MDSRWDSPKQARPTTPDRPLSEFDSNQKTKSGLGLRMHQFAWINLNHLLKIMKSRISVLSTSDVKVVQLNQIRNHFFKSFSWSYAEKSRKVSRDFYLVLQNYTLCMQVKWHMRSCDMTQYVPWCTHRYELIVPSNWF